MKYQAVIASYHIERKMKNVPEYNHLRALEKILNLDVHPAEERKKMEGFTVKEVLASTMREKIVYTVIFQKGK